MSGQIHRTQGSNGLIKCISHTLQWLMPGWLGITGSQADCTSLCYPGMTQGSLEQLQEGSRLQSVHL